MNPLARIYGPWVTAPPWSPAAQRRRHVNSIMVTTSDREGPDLAEVLPDPDYGTQTDTCPSGLMTRARLIAAAPALAQAAERAWREIEWHLAALVEGAITGPIASLSPYDCPLCSTHEDGWNVAKCAIHVHVEQLTALASELASALELALWDLDPEEEEGDET